MRNELLEGVEELGRVERRRCNAADDGGARLRCRNVGLRGVGYEGEGSGRSEEGVYTVVEGAAQDVLRVAVCTCVVCVCVCACVLRGSDTCELVHVGVIL